MKRSAPMKRTPFRTKAAPPRREATQSTYTPKPRLVVVGKPASNDGTFRPQPKDRPIQHAGYMALVRRLACARCGHYFKGRMQFCHADILGVGGKGKGLKSDCRLGWPGCAGCHFLVGSTGALTKEQRHEFEADAGFRTRTAIHQAGKWPARLPHWPADALAAEAATEAA